MTFVALGAVLGGIVGGILMRSIFGGISFTALLILFFVMWRYFKNEVGDEVKGKEKSKEMSTPPVSTNSVPSEQSKEPLYPQNTQKGI